MAGPKVGHERVQDLARLSLDSDVQISVVIPLFNGAATIGQALASVAAQSRPPAEVIVVDDGSSDAGAEIARSFAGRLARLSCLGTPRAGAAGARNRGVAQAAGPWVAFLDADDVWLPHHLEVLTHAARAMPQARVVGAGYVESEAVDRLQARLARSPAPDPSAMAVREVEVFRAAAVGRLPFCTSSVMVEKQAFLAAGGFPEGERRGEDLALWACLAQRFPVAACCSIGVIYRRGLISATSRPLEAADAGIRAYLAVANEPATPASTAVFAREAAYRLALAHALDAIRAGRADIARAVFLPIAAPTRLNRRRLHLAQALARLPSAISARLLGSWLAVRRNQPL